MATVLYELPGVEEMRRAEQHLSAAHDAVENITLPTCRAAGSGDSGEGMATLPTAADVGELYLFAQNLRCRSAEFADMAKEIERALPTLGEMAGNAALMEVV